MLIRILILTLAYGVVVIAAILGRAYLEGLPGLITLFFLGYCAIIVVSQVSAAVMALRRLARESGKKEPAGETLAAG